MSLADWSRQVRARVAADEKSDAISTPSQKYAKVNKRLRALTKKMKIHNPLHLYNTSLGGTFTSVSTTGTLYDLASQIAQGDDYYHRFSSQVYMRRLNIKGVLVPGSAAGNPAICRIAVIRAVAGLAFAGNMTGSYSPIVTGTSLQVYYDRFFTLGTYASIGFPVNLNISLKLNHKQKFSGTGAGSTTGDCLYLIVQSGVVSGTAAPSISGVLEIFFDPM